MGISARRLLSTCCKPAPYTTLYVENFNANWVGTQGDVPPIAGYGTILSGTQLAIAGGKATFSYAQIALYVWDSFNTFGWGAADDYVCEYVFDGPQLPPFVINSYNSASPAARVIDVSGLSIAPSQQNNHFAFGVQGGVEVAWLNGVSVPLASAGVTVQRINPNYGYLSIGNIATPYWTGVISAIRVTKGNRYGTGATISVPTGDLT